MLSSHGPRTGQAHGERQHGPGAKRVQSQGRACGGARWSEDMKQTHTKEDSGPQASRSCIGPDPWGACVGRSCARLGRRAKEDAGIRRLVRSQCVTRGFMSGRKGALRECSGATPPSASSIPFPWRAWLESSVRNSLRSTTGSSRFPAHRAWGEGVCDPQRQFGFLLSSLDAPSYSSLQKHQGQSPQRGCCIEVVRADTPNQCFAHTHPHASYKELQYLMAPEEGIGSLGTGVTDAVRNRVGAGN